MNIALCDDEPSMLKILEQHLRQSVKELQQDINISTYQSGGKLIEDVADIDAVFLDVQMPGMDGYAVGQVISEMNPRCKIIMATGYEGNYKEAFKIGAYRFITKPYVQEDIDEALSSLFESCMGTQAIVVSYNRKNYTFQQQHIEYATSINSYVEICISRKKYRYDKPLKTIIKELDKRLFVQVHRQYIINLSYVVKVENSEIQLINCRLPISRRKAKEVNKRFVDYQLIYGG